MIRRMVRRIGRALTGLSPWVRRRHQEEAVLAVVAEDQYGLRTITVADKLGWPVETTAEVLGRLYSQRRIEINWTGNQRRHRIKGGA